MKKNPLDGDNKSYFLNLVMQLRKVCNHPYLFDGVEEDEAGDLGDHLIQVNLSKDFRKDAHPRQTSESFVQRH